MMTRWFRKWPRLEPLCNIYLGVLYGKELYMENRFLGMVQILETYHRRFIGGQYQSKEEFEKFVYPKLVDAIPDDINCEYRKSLKGKISFGHEYSLRKRLRDLIQKVPETIKEELFGDASRAESRFVDKVVATRNYLTPLHEGARVCGRYRCKAPLVLRQTSDYVRNYVTEGNGYPPRSESSAS